MLIEFWEFDILIPEDNDAATWEMKKWLGGEREGHVPFTPVQMGPIHERSKYPP